MDVLVCTLPVRTNAAYFRDDCMYLHSHKSGGFLMTDALTLFEAKALDTFSEEDIRTLKRQLHCEACSHDEWRMLELMSTAYGLSPFLRQIWAVPKIGVFVGHGGFLTIAHRSGRFAGMDTQSYNADGTEYRGGGHPAYSICRVWLKDAAEPVTKRVFWEEFGEQRTGSQGKKTNWDKMPAYMLEKVAEVHALKRAFSISGVYCPEEMGYDEEEIIPSASVDGEPVEVTRLSKTDSSRPNPETWTVTTSHTDAETCPECGKPSMPDIERFQVQTGFDNARFGTVPAGLCKECATKLYRELLKKEGQ